MKPHPFIEKEFKYRRKAAAAHFMGHKVRAWLYDKIADYYEQRYYNKFMSPQLSWIEHWSTEPGVESSNLSGDAIIFMGNRRRWRVAADCKSVTYG